MADITVDPDAVIRHMANQVGAQAAELAITKAALDAAHARIAELETAAGDGA